MIDKDHDENPCNKEVFDISISDSDEESSQKKKYYDNKEAM